MKRMGNNVNFHPLPKAVLFSTATTENGLASGSNAECGIPCEPVIPWLAICPRETLIHAPADKYNMSLAVSSSFIVAPTGNDPQVHQQEKDIQMVVCFYNGLVHSGAN